MKKHKIGDGSGVTVVARPGKVATRGNDQIQEGPVKQTTYLEYYVTQLCCELLKRRPEGFNKTRVINYLLQKHAKEHGCFPVEIIASETD